LGLQEVRARQLEEKSLPFVIEKFGDPCWVYARASTARSMFF